jgi:hypothetical protein
VDPVWTPPPPKRKKKTLCLVTAWEYFDYLRGPKKGRLIYCPCPLSIFYFSHLVRLNPLGTAATTGLVYQPQMIDDGDCGAIGGIRIGAGNRSTRIKPAPVPLSPP